MFVIDERGNKIGLFQSRDALLVAKERGLDLVEVAPDADPPVCKIMDYGKVKYTRSKAQKRQRKSNPDSVVKEVRLRPNIGENDLQTKQKQIVKFLTKGHRVKVAMKFKRAELRNAHHGKTTFHSLVASVSDISKSERPATQSGNLYSIVLQSTN